MAKGLNVINGKMFQPVIDENQTVVTQRMTLIETFFVGALCMTFILKLNPLFIHSYVYVGSRTIFFPVYLACRSQQATIVLEKYYRFEVSLLSSYAYEGGRNHSSFGRF